MSENTDRFTCFYRQLSTPYIDFDLYLEPQNPKAQGESFLVHLYIDTEDQSLGVGDVRYSSETNHGFEDHCLTADELTYFRGQMVNDPTATQLTNRIAQIMSEHTPQYVTMAPSVQSVMELLDERLFSQSQIQAASPQG